MHQLDVVDDDQPESARLRAFGRVAAALVQDSLVQIARLGADFGQGLAGGVVDVDFGAAEQADRARDVGLLLVGVAADAQAVVFHARLGRDESGGDLLGGHFQAEHRHGHALPQRSVAGDREGQRRFAHGGAGGQHEQVGGVDAAVEQLIEIAEAGARRG